MNKLRYHLGAPARETEDASVQHLGQLALPLEDAKDLDPLIERIGDARFVLLGEASHGTSEFYLSRAALSKRLIEEKGFRFIAVEGDWPDCYRINRYVKGRAGAGASARDVLRAFARWPTWMWANWEVVALAEWLRRHNDTRPQAQKAGFFGLDVYSLWESLDAILDYLERVDPDAAAVARRAYRCFEPYGENMQNYAGTTLLVPISCEPEVVALLTELRRNAPAYREDSTEGYFNAEQNALVVRNAERYYRTMVRGGPASWNLRDRHMAETLERLMRYHGPDAKAIVWEHNTHIGDARATDMARGGMVNVGQLVREAHGDADVVLAGFGSYQGSVIAGREWGARMERMRVPPAREGSWDELMHRTGCGNMLLLPDRRSPHLQTPRGQRAIGVVYDPMIEHLGNYAPTLLPARYDAVLYIDSTRALHPLHVQAADEGEPPDTYPWSV